MRRSPLLILPARSSRGGYTLAELLLWVTFVALLCAVAVMVRDLFHGRYFCQHLTVSADGSTVAAVFRDGSVRVFDVAGEVETKRFQIDSINEFFHIDSNCTALSPDGRWITLPTYHEMRSTRDRIELRSTVPGDDTRIELPVFTPCEVAFLRDGKFLVAANVDVMRNSNSTDLQIWNLQTHASAGQFQVPGSLEWYSVDGSLALSPDGATLAFGTIDTVKDINTIQFWDLASRIERTSWPSKLESQSLRFSPDGKQLALLGYRYTSTMEMSRHVQLRDAATGKILHELELDDPYYGKGMEFSADGSTLVLPGRPLRLWNLPTGDLRQPDGAANDEPDGGIIAGAPEGGIWAVSDGTTITLWDARTMSPGSVLYRASFLRLAAANSIGFGLWGLWWGYLRRRKRIAPPRKDEATCAICNHARALKKHADLPVCVYCWNQVISQPEFHQQLRRTWGRLLILVTIVAGLLGWLRSSWLTFIGFELAPLAGIIPAMVWAYGRYYLAAFRTRSRDWLLKTARADARVAGVLVQGDGLWAWFERDAMPVDQLQQLLHRSHERYVGLTGDHVELVAPPPILQFYEPASYAAHLRNRRISHVAMYSAVYGHRVIANCAQLEDERLEPRDSGLIAVFALHWKMLAGRLPARQWLIDGLIAEVVDEHTARVQRRRMLRIAIAAAAVFGQELFQLTPGQALARRSRRYSPVERIGMAVRTAQAQSLVEYVGGDGAPLERRLAFQAYWADREAQKRPGVGIERYFGKTPAELLDDWRTWLLQKEITPPAMPTPEHRETLVKTLLPRVSDKQVKYTERFDAVMAMANGGYLLGTDVLVQIVGDASESADLRTVATWALQVISGEVHAEPDAWFAWWEALPAEPRQESCSQIAK